MCVRRLFPPAGTTGTPSCEDWEQLPAPGLTGNVALGTQKPPCPLCPLLGHVPQLSVPVEWEPLHWCSFQITESPQTFPQTDNASSASLPGGMVWAALQGSKAISKGLPHAPPTAGTAVSSRLLPKCHTTKEPHTLSFLLLCFNLDLYLHIFTQDNFVG